MKNVLCKIISFLVNLMEGAVAILAVVVIYAFIFEADNIDHDIGLGLFFLFIWVLVLLPPNLFFKFSGKFHIKDVMIFQLVPFILGIILIIVYQLVLRDYLG